MSREALLKRMAALKATTSKPRPEPAPAQVADETSNAEIEEHKPTPLQLLQARKAAASSPAAKAVQELNANTNAKVVKEESSEAPVDVNAIKLIIDDVSELNLCDEAKGISGFNPTSFETRLKEINLMQEQAFPEIQAALTVINKDLRKFPELAHLLSDKQIKVIVQRILHEKHAFIAPQKKDKAKKAASKDPVKAMKDKLKEQAKFEGGDDDLSADDL